ncbi:MAG: hypothetical protein KKC37_11245 [Proteobacteria bacterium]|nr:hypothetical protein [Pseudomonadota bacterium]
MTGARIKCGVVILSALGLTACAATIGQKISGEKREYASQQRAFMSRYADLGRHARAARRLWGQFRFGLNDPQRRAYAEFMGRDDQAALTRLWHSLSAGQKGILARWHMEARICRHLYDELQGRDKKLSALYARMSDAANRHRLAKPDSTADPAQRAVLDEESYAEQQRRRLLATFKPGSHLWNRLAGRLDLMR